MFNRFLLKPRAMLPSHPSFMQCTTTLLKEFAHYRAVAMASAGSLFWRVGLCLG